MPIALVLVLVHVFLLRDQGLGVFKISMTLIAAAGLVLFAWRRLVAPSLRSRHPWKVAGVTQVSDSITTLAFEHPGGRRLRHHPGQFCYLFPLNDELPRESHPFTISSSPADPRPTVTVKNLGDFTAQVRALKPGDAVCLEGAYGRFSYQHVPENRELVFIAGGIGITPMLSMLRHISREDPKRKVTLVWGARNAEDLICREEFEIWSREMENFLFEPVLSRARQWEGRIGRIDKALLADVFENKNGQDGPVDRSTAEFFICGPPAMVRTVLHALTDLGFAARRIHTERFAF